MPGRSRKNQKNHTRARPKLPEVPSELVPVDEGESWLGAIGITATKDRVNFIAQLMVQGIWDKDAAKQLADEWDMSVTRVQQLASNSSLVLECTVEDREKLIKMSLLRLREIQEENSPDRTRALDISLKVAGAYNHAQASPQDAASLRERIVRDLASPSSQLRQYLREAWGKAKPEVLRFYQTLGDG